MLKAKTRKVTEDMEDREDKYLNEREREALEKQVDSDKEDSSKVATVRMEKALKVVSDKFNLTNDDFILKGFSDKGTKFQMSMSNDDFDITILVKDTEKFEIE